MQKVTAEIFVELIWLAFFIHSFLREEFKRHNDINKNEVNESELECGTYRLLNYFRGEKYYCDNGCTNIVRSANQGDQFMFSIAYLM